jgi:type IX secretion system PorP/SprF family membrane protein
LFLNIGVFKAFLKYFNRNNMRKTLTKLAVAVTGLFSVAYAQQDPQFTQFMHVKQAYNSAQAGTSGAMCFNGMFRQQWVSFPGAPRTGLFTFDMPVEVLRGGVGLFIANDQLGNDNTTMARAAYSFHIPINTGKLAIGLDAGILQKRISGNWTPPQTLNDPSIPNNTTTGAPNLNKLSPDFGFSLYYTVPNKMYVGLSTTHLAGQDLKGATGQGGNSGNNPYKLSFDIARHYYAIAGYTFSFDAGTHKVTPNIKVKSDGAATILDVNATYMWNNMVWVGATYRVQDAVAPMLGMMTKFGLKVGYSYDLTLSKINGYSSGTHEIMLGYCFKSAKPPKVSSHTNVRFLED